MSQATPADIRRNRPVRSWLSLALCLLMVLAPVARPQAAIFGEFTIKDEVELGRKFEVLVKSRLPLIEDPEITGYVRDVVNRLLKVMPAMPFDVTVNVILHPAINAFAAPAGFVFVNSGLILNFDNESELAGVLAHELAHVSQRHIASRIERMQALSLLSIAGVLAAVFLGGDNADAIVVGSFAASQAAELKYTRDNEREADHVGISYLIDAGYPPQGLANGFRAIIRNQWLGGGSTIPAYLSTHPGLQERIGYLEQRVNRLPAHVQNVKDDNIRLRRVQTLLRARYTDADTAQRHFDTTPDQDPFLRQLGLGIIYERTNRIGMAREAFAEAQVLRPQDQLFVREFGIFNYKHGTRQDAELYLQRAVFEKSDDLMALFYYARLLNESGNQKQALQYYERIVRRLPHDAEVHYFYGRTLGENQQYFKAHLHLAYSALHKNDKRQLRFHMEKAERLAASEAQKKEFDKFKELKEEHDSFR